MRPSRATSPPTPSQSNRHAEESPTPVGQKSVKPQSNHERIGDVLIRGAEAAGLGFPSGHAAVASALATAAGPYVSQRARRVMWVAVWAVALARVYVGSHFPIDVIGGVALGWAIGSEYYPGLKAR